MSSRIVTVPNLLTVFRMVLIPVFVSLLFYQRFVLALVVFVLAGVTDGLDGLLARRFNQKSQLGTILDPIADKLMLVTAFVVLSMRSVFPQPLPSHLPVPFWVTVAVISRDVFILVGAAAINIVTGLPWFPPLDAGENQHDRSNHRHRHHHVRRQRPLRHRLLPAHPLHHRLRLRRPFRRPLRLFRLQTGQRRPPLRKYHLFRDTLLRLLASTNLEYKNLISDDEAT